MVMFHKRGMRGVEGSDGVRPQSWGRKCRLGKGRPMRRQGNLAYHPG